MLPTKGRIVFWTKHHNANHREGPIVEELVGVVTYVRSDGEINLRVFAEVGEDLRLFSVKAGPNEGAQPADGCWHWPPIAKPAAPPKPAENPRPMSTGVPPGPPQGEHAGMVASRATGFITAKVPPIAPHYDGLIQDLVNALRTHVAQDRKNGLTCPHDSLRALETAETLGWKAQ